MATSNQTKKKTKSMFLAITSMVVIAVLLGYIMWEKNNNEKQLTVKNAVTTSKPEFLTLQPFVVTVSDDTRLHHMMLELDLMSYDREMFKQLEAIQPLIRNRILKVVNTKNLEDLTSVNVIATLQSDILVSIHQLQEEMSSIYRLEKVLIMKLVIQ